MNVLFLCHRVPFPPKRGGKIRPFNIVRHLSRSGHRVTVASLARSRAELEESRGLAQHCERALVEVVLAPAAWGRMLARLPTAEPSSFGYFHSGRLRRRLAAEFAARPPDLVFAHCTSVAPYVERRPAPLKILDYGDMDSQKWREYSRHRAQPFAAGYWLEAVKLERRERALAAGFDLCTCTTRAELDTLRALGVRKPSDWFPNGVDADYFSPAEGAYEADRIAFIGRMDYYPNQDAVTWFCRELLPGIRARRPGARLSIIGAEPPPHILRLAQPGVVEVSGSVPDVRPLLRRAAVTVAPLRIARGTQNKILESMAMGVPVVSSPEAAGGVDAVPGAHFLTAATPAEWIAAVTGVLADPGLRAALARAARERVLSHHSWDASMRRLDRLIEEARVRKSAAAAG